MALDKMQIEVQRAVYGAIYKDGVFLRDYDRYATNDSEDAMVEFKIILDGIAGLVHEGVFISSTDTSGVDDMQFISREAKYGSNYFLTQAEATALRGDVITGLTSSNITSYKDVFIRSVRNDQSSSDLYPGHSASNDGLEIFIFDITWKSKTYLEPSGADNMDDFLSEINTSLDTINGLEFAGIVGSSAKGIATQIFFGLDDATYNGNKYLSPAQMSTLRAEVINILDSMGNVDSYGEVTILTSRKDNQNSDDY